MSCRNLTHSLTVSISLKAILRKNLALIFENVCFERWGLALIYSSQTPWQGVNIAQKTGKDENILLSCFSINPIISQLQWDFVLRLFFEGKTHFRSWCSWHLRGGRRCPRCRTPSWSRRPPARAPRGKAAKEKTLKLGWGGHDQRRGGGAGEGESVCQLLAVSV